MRIISFLLVASGAAAMGGAALAQSGSLPGRPGGNPPSVSGSWLKGPAFGRHHHFRPGMNKGPGRHHGRPGRHHRDHGRFNRGGERFVLPYGGIGYVEAYEAVDPHGNGFFAGSGGEVRLRGGRPYYDYDRSYPYEWGSAAAGHVGFVGGEDHPGQADRCSDEHGVRVCRSRR